MLAFNILKVVCLALFLYRSLAVPIGRVVGCGKEDPNLSPEQRKFCCESFSLDCVESDPVSSRSAIDSPTKSNTKRPPVYERLVPRRKMGSPCREPYFACAVGLECRMGLCRRVRTREHLERLLERGREVEREEKQDLEDDGPSNLSQKDELDGDLMLRGQSVSAEDMLPGGFPRSTNYGRKEVRAEKQNLKNDDSMYLRKTSDQDTYNATDVASSMFEEDEVAANVADLLSAQLQMPLNASQVRSIRDIIAGTLDERAEREDEADGTEQVKVENMDKPRASHTGRDSNPNHTCSAKLIEI